MEDNIFDIRLEHAGMQYKGWVHPSEKLNEQGLPTSYHVVLNDIAFGDMSFHNCRWSNTEWRPDALVKLVGEQIEKKYKL